ncbi:hypothetical protein [Sphingomonas sp. F9_3S_D5_B_2]
MKPDNREEIIIIGDRRSAVTNVAPVATFDSRAISGTGATSMAELLRIIKPLAKSSDGGEPIYLLNGQRVSGYEEIGSLPPEAIEKVEVLPEAAALKFGYPPTRRLMNFITKRSFRQIEFRGSLGSTTRPGSLMANGNVNVTRLRKNGRVTLALESRHTSSLLQSERHVAPDPDLLFDGLGNVTGLGLGEIDPALSQLAGQVVTVAPVPDGGGASGSLGGFAAGANQTRLFDVGPYRDLVPHNDAWKAEGVVANKLGGTLSGSLNLTAERSTDRSTTGPAAATLTVPATNPFSPFGNDVLLHRYLTEVEPLHVRQTTTTLHGGGTLRGVTAGWRWDLTGAFDQKQISGISELGIDLAPANAAIAAGTNPFAPLDPALLAGRLTDRARLRTRNMGTKLVVSRMPLHLPAGEVTVTGTLEAERLSADSVTRGANPFALQLGRTRSEAGLAVDVPLTSRADHVLGAVGDLSVNASAVTRRVTGVGGLHDRTLGLNWRPLKGLQVLVQDKRSGTAPDMEKLASPVVRVANFGVFDFATGRTEVVTLTTGGNPDLSAERRHSRSITVVAQPFPKTQLNVSATFDDTDIRNQTGDIFVLTPEFEDIFPDRFVRDSSGRLVAVTFAPTNFYRERQRSLAITVNANGVIGKKPAPGKDGKEGNRPNYYGGIGPTFRFTDKLQLRPGTRTLDLLHGDTVKGWAIPRATAYFYGGIGYLGNGISIDGWLQNAGRIRSDNPASDLYFGPIVKLNVGAFVSVHHFLRKQAWTKHTQLKLDFNNITDSHQHVHDANGRVPNRFQPDLLDPVGRTVKLTLRKLF